MNFLLALISGQSNDHAHSIMARYGRGIFEGPVAQASASGNKLKISGSYLYTPVLAQLLSDRCDSDLAVQGLVLSKDRVDDKLKLHGLEIDDVTKRGGYKYKVSAEISPGRFGTIYDALWDFAVLLKAKARGYSYSTGSSVPKPNKFSEPEFCNLTMPDCEDARAAVLDALVPRAGSNSFESLTVGHRFRIDELSVPAELAGKPASVIRLEAKRKGVLARRLDIDGRVVDEEFPFLA